MGFIEMDESNNRYVCWSESKDGILHGPIVIESRSGKMAAEATFVKLDLCSNATIEIAEIGSDVREWYQVEIELKVKEI